MPFAFITLLTALLLASVAGWFSIVGFMTIYAGAPMYAMIMGVVTECAKLVTTSWLYRNWKYANWKLKLPLIYFTIALMSATSIGVFGFLSKAHLEQGASTIDNSSKIQRLADQISREESTIRDNEKIIGQLDATIDSFLGKDRTDRSLAVRKSQAPQRKQLRDDIILSQSKIDTLTEEKSILESEIKKLQLEVGPIRYIAELFFGVEQDSTKNIESAVKIFTLLLVSTLDPLAIILLIAANHTILRLKNPSIGPEHPSINPTMAENKIESKIINLSQFAREKWNRIKKAPKVNTVDVSNDTPLAEKTEIEDNLPSESIVENITVDETDNISDDINQKVHNASYKIYDNSDFYTNFKPELDMRYIPSVKINEIRTSIINSSHQDDGILNNESSDTGTQEIIDSPNIHQVNSENIERTIPWASQEEILVELLGNDHSYNDNKNNNDSTHKVNIEEESKDIIKSKKEIPRILGWITEFKGNK